MRTECLTEVIRQKGDAAFTTLLNEVSVLMLPTAALLNRQRAFVLLCKGCATAQYPPLREGCCPCFQVEL
jgi:hypothetical protein